MSLESALTVAAGGLANISQQIAVISNNISNASTPEYAREVGTQTSLTAGGQGYGVLSGPVIREIDLQLQGEVLQQNATVSGLQTRQQALQPVDATQGTPGGGADLSSALGSLQDAFTSLQSDPSSSSSQSEVVAAASALTGHINNLSKAYSTARQDAQDNIQSGLTSLNSAIATVSSLSDRIVDAQSQGLSTADLSNQRDVAMTAMSALVEVSFKPQSNGGLLAVVGGGMALSMRSPPPQFVQNQAAVAQQTYYPGGGIQPITLEGADVTGQMKGGQIGANIELRDQTLPAYQGELDEFANTLQNRFSVQGLQLFTSPTSSTSTVVPAPAQLGYLGYSATIAVNPSVLANPAQVRDGNVVVSGSAGGATAFTPNPVTGPAGFGVLLGRVLSYSFGTQVQSGVGQPAPAVSGLGPLGSLSAPYAAPQSLAGFATVLVAAQSADVGNTTTQLATETSVQTSLQARVTGTSGVSTDTELANMVGLQNAYGANARVIAAAQAMWTQLLTSVT